MNYESMGNIYKGLASSGCWGCFDEFNRLLPETLSVCSVQFKSITDAIVKKFIEDKDKPDIFGYFEEKPMIRKKGKFGEYIEYDGKNPEVGKYYPEVVTVLK